MPRSGATQLEEFFMADTEKSEGKKKKVKPPGAEDRKNDRKRLSYLKQRAKELKKEQQAIKDETNALRTKMGVADRGKKPGAGGGEDDED
jgi:hypothetical protein